MHRLQPFEFFFTFTHIKEALSFPSTNSLSSKSLFYIQKMRLSLIFFGLSSVFMIVSSLPLGSVGLEKRQASGALGTVTNVVDGAAGGAGGAVDATTSPLS
jgi:hypothetical protein